MVALLQFFFVRASVVSYVKFLSLFVPLALVIIISFLTFFFSLSLSYSVLPFVVVSLSLQSFRKFIVLTCLVFLIYIFSIPRVYMSNIIA